MKKVFSNYSDVCHLWAHHSQSEAESGNVRFDEERLFSYGTCIGERFEINGNIVFVCNDYAFSKSTGRHQSAMHGAIPDEDPNVHVFHVNYSGWGNESITSFWHGRCRNKETEGYFKRDLIRFASLWLASLWNQCLGVNENNRADIGVDLGLFDTFKRYYEVTGLMTMKKLLRLTDNELSQCMFGGEFNGKFDVRKVRKFMRLLVAGSDLETIVDFVAGKGKYAAYMKRTEHLHLSAKLRRMSLKIGFRLPGLYDWRCDGNVREGSIKTSEYKKRKADGTLISWMLEQKKLNMSLKAGRKEYDDFRDRRSCAKQRLERYLGFSGWETYRSRYEWGRKKKCFTSFDYDGEVFSFSGCGTIDYQSLSDKDYLSFTKISKAEQKAFVHEKRLWMLSHLKEEKARHEAWEAEAEERRRIREEERKRREAFRAEVQRAKDEGDYDKLRDYWYQGLVGDSTVQGFGPMFYRGGNVLLKVTDKLVMSSKGISVAIAEAVRMWKIVKRWHNDESTFVADSEKFHTTLSNYGVSRYQNDILIAGCHAIAYKEMERAAVELGIEKKEEEKTAFAITA
ncbi:MAG: hypothetical protein ACI4SO_07560 [Muribaculaceae bacterium]